MGIPFLFSYLRKRFDGVVTQQQPCSVDVLLIDANGIFHHAAQKVYEYGDYSRPPTLLTQKSPERPERTQQKERAVFREVCKSIDKLVALVRPYKRVMLCVDGVAPKSKQNQQRQRRYKAAKETQSGVRTFDSNAITPGTEFMHRLTRHIDRHLQRRRWMNVEVVFSNEKVAGEGEHKLMDMLRQNPDPNLTYCLFGPDADLIMLVLGTQLPRFLILREDHYRHGIYNWVNVKRLREELLSMLRWTGKRTFDPARAINDFILIAFSVGNDFLPHIPAIEIINDGLEDLFRVYREVGEKYGHLTHKDKLCRGSLKQFFVRLGQMEKAMLEKKLNNPRKFYFPDEVLDSNVVYDASEGRKLINLEEYKVAYYKAHGGAEFRERSPLEYLKGLQWVLTYYLRGCPDWDWSYPFHYAPFASDLPVAMKDLRPPSPRASVPSKPFQQLLSVLPPSSADRLLPGELSRLLREEPLASLSPEDFPVDYAGKYAEWEGLAIVPIVDVALVKRVYEKAISEVATEERKRDIRGKVYLYKAHSADRILLSGSKVV